MASKADVKRGTALAAAVGTSRYVRRHPYEQEVFEGVGVMIAPRYGVVESVVEQPDEATKNPGRFSIRWLDFHTAADQREVRSGSELRFVES